MLKSVQWGWVHALKDNYYQTYSCPLGGIFMSYLEEYLEEVLQRGFSAISPSLEKTYKMFRRSTPVLFLFFINLSAKMKNAAL